MCMFLSYSLSDHQKCYALSCAFSPGGKSLVTTLSRVSTSKGATYGRVVVSNYL